MVMMGELERQGAASLNQLPFVLLVAGPSDLSDHSPSCSFLLVHLLPSPLLPLVAAKGRERVAPSGNRWRDGGLIGQPFRKIEAATRRWYGAYP